MKELKRKIKLRTERLGKHGDSKDGNGENASYGGARQVKSQNIGKKDRDNRYTQKKEGVLKVVREIKRVWVRKIQH